ncbi:SWIM zinc finger domain containing protein [Entamoeba histolytica HM-3:IMSS]|uniref:SWIM zinc finger domain containing protein n=2 Tax=Entamoeba histolytica TaxID=5759 RepID=M2RIU5_ENTHI|nr:SWIM zinc finger domain containing protein [Entamoeba histolytica KU27]EMS11423.1 SWIM zinc finger domain containing protein [Entamoeba histolytica HM-3:IMSS]
MSYDEKLEVNGVWPSKSALKAAVIANGVANPNDRRYWKVIRSSKEYLSLTCCFAVQCNCPAILRASRSSKLPGRPWVVREVCLKHGNGCKGKTPKKFFGTDFIKSVLPPELLLGTSTEVAKYLEEKSGLSVARRTISRLQKGSKPKIERISQVVMEFLRKNPGSSASIQGQMVRIVFGVIKNALPYLQHSLISSDICLNNGYHMVIISGMDGERQPLPLCFALALQNIDVWEFVYEGLQDILGDGQDSITKTISNIHLSNESIYKFELNDSDTTMTKTLCNIINTISSLFESRRRQIQFTNSKLVNWLNKDIEWKIEGASQIECYGEFPLYYTKTSVPLCIDLKKKTCSCGEFQRTGTPCIHAVSVIHHLLHEDYEQYVDPCYFASSLKKTYLLPVVPISFSAIKQNEERKRVCEESSEDLLTKRKIQSPITFSNEVNFN